MKPSRRQTPKPQRNAGLAQERLTLWRHDPVQFVRDVFRVEPDPKQVDILHDFGNPDVQRIACKAATGTGKTTTEAWCIWNYYVTRPNPKGAATSVTSANLRDNLWAEIQKWQAKSELLTRMFDVTANRLMLRERAASTWFAARSWSRDATPEQQALTLSGLHADYPLAVVDEAGGVPDAVVEAGERMLSTSRRGKLLVFGNATHLSGPLYRAFQREQRLYRLHSITSDPLDPARSPRVDPTWAQEQIDRHGGRDAYYVRVFILGLFPLGELDGLIPMSRFDDAFAAYDRAASGLIVLPRGPKTLGVDVARKGNDKSVVILRDGAFIEGVRWWQNYDTEYTADEVARISDEFSLWLAPGDTEPRPVLAINVDDIGVGGGVTDKLARRNQPVVGVDVGKAASDTDRYKNLRAELSYGELRLKYFVPGTIALHPSLRETSLTEEGTGLRYKFGDANVVQIEPKDAYKKRNNGASPDYWDALALAFATRGVDLEAMGWF